MARIREKHVKDIPYYSIVTSARIGPNKVPHEITLEYIGNLDQLKAYALSAYLEKNGTETHSAESDSQKKPQTFKSYNHGACYAMYRMGHYLGIDKILEEEFASRTIKGLSRGTVLLLAIIHRAVDPGSMSDFPDWFKQSSLPYHLRIDPDLLTPQDIWEAMDGITEGPRQKACVSSFPLFQEVKQNREISSSSREPMTLMEQAMWRSMWVTG